MLASHGAVYAPVAAAMADGVRTRLGATSAWRPPGSLAPTPRTGSRSGTVHIAVSLADDTVVRTIVLAGDRHEIRRLTVERVLGLLLGRLREECRRDYSVTLGANTRVAGSRRVTVVPGTVEV